MIRRPHLVIFDCDGVLVDSETPCNRIVAEFLTEAGWTMTLDEAHRRFVGRTFAAVQADAEARLARPLGVDWVARVVNAVTAVMTVEAALIPGARGMLEDTTALGLPWRIASNSSNQELAAKFARTGLAALVAGRVHSAYDVIAAGGRPKPAPDVYLAAAGAEGVPPEACLVVEDSVPGVTAAVAAGMTCLGYAPDADGAALAAAGAIPIHALRDVPVLLLAALERQR